VRQPALERDRHAGDLGAARVLRRRRHATGELDLQPGLAGRLGDPLQCGLVLVGELVDRHLELQVGERDRLVR
jgi:hypothetical protein